MDSLDPLNSVAGGVTSFDTVRLIMLMIGTFFFGALTAAINEGSKNKDGLVKKNKSNNTNQRTNAASRRHR